jgi:hypothetical protein
MKLLRINRSSKYHAPTIIKFSRGVRLIAQGGGNKPLAQLKTGLFCQCFAKGASAQFTGLAYWAFSWFFSQYDIERSMIVHSTIMKMEETG